jgi:hypothetical protein
MGLLSKDQIWAANDLSTVDVSVPEWGGEVRLKTLTGAERDQYEADSFKMHKGRQEANLSNLRARLVAMCAVDENGQPLFTRGDVLKLGQKSAIALERVFEAAARINGMSDEDVEVLAGNSEGGPNEGSTSDLPHISA